MGLQHACNNDRIQYGDGSIESEGALVGLREAERASGTQGRTSPSSVWVMVFDCLISRSFFGDLGTWRKVSWWFLKASNNNQGTCRSRRGPAITRRLCLCNRNNVTDDLQHPPKA